MSANLRFGSVQITVHDGRVTQVESIEKTRFVAPATTRRPGLTEYNIAVPPRPAATPRLQETDRTTGGIGQGA